MALRSKFSFTNFLAVSVAVGGFVSGCGKVQLGTSDGSGLVKRVDSVNRMITLDHSAVGTLMPPMLMAYSVEPSSLIHNVQVGDSAAFTLTEKTPGTMVITAIHKK